MAKGEIQSWINLAAAILIFAAAVIPVSYKIWTRARDNNAPAVNIRAIFSVISVIFMIAGCVLSIFCNYLLDSACFFLRIVAYTYCAILD